MVSLLLRRCGLVRFLFVPLLVVLTQIAPAAAREGDDEADYDVRIYRVGALTAGRNGFIGERRPPVGPDDVSDESCPFMGALREEAELPYGDVDDLIALVRNLAVPSAWEDSTDNAYLRAHGDHAIVARHRAEVLDEVALVLADLERRALTTVTVELRAIRVPSGEPMAAVATKAARLLKSESSGPSLALTGFMGQRISGFSGRQSSYVIDYDVEVDEKATASDPIVAVDNLGMRADVRVVPRAGGRSLHIDVQAWLADLTGSRDVATGDRRSVESRDIDITVARGVVEAQPGAWTVVSGRGGEGGWTVFVRAAPRGWGATPARPPSLRIPAASAQAEIVKLLDVRDLTQLVPSRMGEYTHLVPSNYTPPEPDELPDPLASFEAHELSAVIKQASPTRLWAKSALMEAGPGTLLVRNTPNVLAGVTEVVTALRRQFLVSVTSRVDVIELPATLLEQLRGAGTSRAWIRGEDGPLARALKGGTATRLDWLEVVNRAGVRNVVTSGRVVSYLQDYEVEIAKDATIGNPVVQALFVGAQLDVTPHVTTDGKGVALDVRFVRTNLETPIRRVETPWGALEMPELDAFRVRSGLVVPSGQTVLLAARGDGPERLVLLLTSTINRSR